MIPTSSEFYNRLNIMEATRIAGINNLKGKGIDIGDNASIPSIMAQIPNIDSSPIDINEIVVEGNSVIITAELADTVIELRKDNVLLETKNTGIDGGAVSFVVTEYGEYEVKAIKDSVDLWTNAIEVNSVGVFNCKAGKSLRDYTFAEIKEAGTKDFAKYMWSVGNEIKLPSFMGSETDAVTVFVIAGFNIKEKVGGGFGITFMQKGQTSATYQYWSDSNTNSNGVSFEGSLFRQNMLRAGQFYYVYDRTVTSSTSGAFYTWDNDNKLWLEKTLPADFVANTKYYVRNTKTEDGAFWEGLPEDIKPLISQVKNKTWSGYGGTVTNSTTANADNTIIETKDWLFMPSDSEVFGDSERINNYSKYALEGEQFPYFNKYQEGRLQRSSNSWTRSPSLSTSISACSWGSSGYVYYSSTNSSSRVVLCFTL